MYSDKELTYEAPLLEEPDINQAIQSGLLGDSICHVTVEQLKAPSSALVLQLCTSILQKLGIETDNLGQALLIGELVNPELYGPTTMMTINVPFLLNRSVPQLRMERRDLIYPKWKRIHHFLNIIINYIRSWDFFMTEWETCNSKSVEILQKRQDLLDENSKLENSLRDVNDYLRRHETLFADQLVELNVCKGKFQKILDEQKLKEQDKAAAKMELSKCNEELTSANEDLSKYLTEKQNLQDQVVSSPGKQLEKRKVLLQKKETAKENFVKNKELHREIERKIDRLKQTVERGQHDIQLRKEYCSSIEHIQLTKDNLMKIKFETETRSLSMAKLRKENENLSQQIATNKDQIRRLKLRGEKQIKSAKQHLLELEGELTGLSAKVESKNTQIKSRIKEIESAKALKEKIISHHIEKMEKLRETEKLLLHDVDKINDQLSLYMEEVVANCS